MLTCGEYIAFGANRSMVPNVVWESSVSMLSACAYASVREHLQIDFSC